MTGVGAFNGTQENSIGALATVRTAKAFSLK
jgi:hypothetical protein